MSFPRFTRLTACLLLVGSPSLYADPGSEGEAHTLAPVDVVGASVDDYDAAMITEGADSYATDATNTATRMVLSPRETPQSVTVITRQQMEDFGLNSVHRGDAANPRRHRQ